MKRKTRTRVGLFGIFGAGNSGNDGSLETMLLFLGKERPEAELVCICTNPGAVQKSLGVRALPIGIQQPRAPTAGKVGRILGRFSRETRNFVRAFRICRTLDALIIPGTGILDDFGESPFGVPAALLGWCLAAKLTGTRLSFVSIGAGPIKNSINRWLMKNAAKLAAYRSYRDVTSKEFMARIGIDTRNDPIFPDVVFNLPTPKTNIFSIVAERPIIGIGVMAYRGWRNGQADGEALYRSYIEKMATFSAWVLDQGYRVRVLMGDLGDQKAVSDLLAALESQRANIPLGSVLTNPISNLHDLMRQIASTHLVVATRFHNIVCALKLCRPTLSIGYSRKNDDLMLDLGLGEYCQSIDALDVERLKAQFIKLMERKDFHRETLMGKNKTYQDRLHIQNVLLLSQIPQGEQNTMSLSERDDVETQNLKLVRIEDKFR